MTLRPLDSQRRALLERAVSTYERAMPGSEASTYLAGRAISPRTVALHRLGYAGPSASIPELERFTHHVVIPYFAPDGHCTAIRFRALDPDAKAKYDAPAGQATRLYNVAAMEMAGDTLSITEGEIDAISLSQLGLYAIAVPGNQTWKSHYSRLLEGFRRIVLFRDNDEAGELLEQRIRAKAPDLPLVSVLPPGGLKDVNEALCAGLGNELIQLANGR